jgi:large subunit ribosomal protein L24e
MCDSIIYPGHGSLLIKNDMRSLWFCRSKCKKNYKQKKNPLFLRWTQLNRKKRGIILSKSKFFSSFTHKKIEKLRKYDEYVIAYILYQAARFKQHKINRAIDFKSYIFSTK